MGVVIYIAFKSWEGKTSGVDTSPPHSPDEVGAFGNKAVMNGARRRTHEEGDRRTLLHCAQEWSELGNQG